MAVSRPHSSIEIAEARSYLTIGMFITACWMLDLTNTVMPPYVGLGPLRLYVLYPGFHHTKPVGSFVSKMIAMSV